MPGVLYVVATPIGNLEDFTYRAVRVLREANWIACEDTRTTKKLLDHYAIQTRTLSYHEHNEAARTEDLIGHLLNGETGALVSDAGTPLLKPGFAWRRCRVRRRCWLVWLYPDCLPINSTSQAFCPQNRDSGRGC